MRLSSFLFLLYEGFRNVWRNGVMSLAALGTVTIALTVLGASLWSAYRIHEIALEQPQKLNEIDVFLNVNVSRAAALQTMAKIQALPDVSRLKLVRREDAWSEIEAGQPALKETALENPLPDAFRVETSSVQRIDSLTRLLRDPAKFPEINWVNDSNHEIKSMLALANAIKIVGTAVSLGLVAATLYLVHNTIRLTVFARRREIRIMQLVGATPGFIRFPLLLEGVFYGVMGGIAASGLLWLGAREISLFLQQLSSPLLSEIPTRLTVVDALSGLIAIGALIGLSGSYLALRRFLKPL